MNFPADSDSRFSGSERLFGREGLRRLRGARMTVIGIGGVGSWTAEALARAGVGQLTLVDLDEICVTNVNRQVHALNATVGRMKVEAMAARIREIDPSVSVTADPRFFTGATCGEILGAVPDVVIDCIDHIPHKCLLLSECRARGLSAVTVGGAGGRMDPTQVRCEDLTRTFNDPLLQRVRKRLRQKFDFPRNTKKKWGIPAVFSPEPQRYPHADGTVCAVREEGSNLRLDCESGYGTAGYVTGAFGFAAAYAAIQTLLAGE